jgi:hypothetical protein
MRKHAPTVALALATLCLASAVAYIALSGPGEDDEVHLHRRLARHYSTGRRNAAGVKCNALLGGTPTTGVLCVQPRPSA